MQQRQCKNFFTGLIMFLLLGCEGEQGPIGPSGVSSLLEVTNEPAGDNCENGGIKVEVGTDANSNGSLEIEEILTSSYVCNGVDGKTSLTSTTVEAPGVNCVKGGVKIDSGVDNDANGSLDESEINTTAYVCNGADQNDTLTKINSEAAGENCENGGMKIDTGVDNNRNGTLDDSEIRTSAYVCNGGNGKSSLIKINNEEAGLNCETGGVTIDSGVDDNGSGTLDEDEIEMTRIVCNGNNENFDEQIRLVIFNSAGNFEGGGLISGSTSGDFFGDLTDFDIRNFPGVDSAVFAARMYCSSSGCLAVASLANSVDSSMISNSTVSTSSLDPITVFSGNIYDDLPLETVDLSLKLSSPTRRAVILNGKSYLFLYRSN